VGAAQKPPRSPNPAPLWNAYPLDDDGAGSGASTTSTTTTANPSSKPTQTAQAPAPTQTAPATVTTHEQAGNGPPWLLIVLSGAGGVLFVVVLLRLQGRLEARREAPLSAPADEWPWLAPTPAAADDDRPHPGSAAKVAQSGPAFEVVDLISVPVRRFEHSAEAAEAPQRERFADETQRPRPARFERGADVPHRGRFERGADVPHRGRLERAPEPDPSPQARAAAGRRGPICQVRWSPRATRFYAVTTDQDGVEHPLARSPRVDSADQGPPPEDSREAQSALRLLAKELREKGWRPMRAKGYDFEAQQWYARRFRFPVVEGEDERAPWHREDPDAVERRRA
jgi:hypothetical protein